MPRTIVEQKSVDFLPRRDIRGDLRKVSEYSIAVYNSLVNAVINMLTMEKGSNQLYPDMGCKEDLIAITYIPPDMAYDVLEGIKNTLTRYVGHEVYIDYKRDPRDSEKLLIDIVIPGLPRTTVAIGPKSRYVKILTPSEMLGAA